ncbi:ParB/RepB/Spo0J family partition protein [Streptomyces sp. NPDC006368]|uniref:ParB/RepB/Spo0J family partition protein n=1 Tax=Streptomyces sp. NPDC006368 TaxID=3156760 RepID=UPI00339F4BA9
MADGKVEFINIKVSEIAPNPEQPRKFFSQEAQEELTNSIKENGLLQPVVVRPVEGGKVPYMLIAGERRWRSCQAAGLEVIPAKVVEGATEEEAYVLSIAENVNRADMTIMEEACVRRSQGRRMDPGEDRQAVRQDRDPHHLAAGPAHPAPRGGRDGRPGADQEQPRLAHRPAQPGEPDGGRHAIRARRLRQRG